MTVGENEENEENEENGSSSNTIMADIKKKNIEEQEQEQEQDINLQIGTSTSQEQMEIVSIKEGSERSPKRSRNTESNDAESSDKNEQESDSDSDSDSIFNELGQDPLFVTEKILLEYNDFIEYVHQILKIDEEKQDWSEITERVEVLIKSLNRNLTVVTLDMQRLRNQPRGRNDFRFRKTHIPNILAVIRHINTGIASSRSFRLVSNIKNRGEVLPLCLREFEKWRQELNQLIDAMETLKKMASEISSDDESEQAMEEDEEQID